MTVNELRSKITQVEFLEWQAYYGIQQMEQELAMKGKS